MCRRTVSATVKVLGLHFPDHSMCKNSAIFCLPIVTILKFDHVPIYYLWFHRLSRTDHGIVVVALKLRQSVFRHLVGRMQAIVYKSVIPCVIWIESERVILRRSMRADDSLIITIRRQVV